MSGNRPEDERLDLQHDMLKVRLGNLVIEPAQKAVGHALREDEEKDYAILDIGAGSGAWAVDMAEDYPYAKVIGIDLTVPQRSKYVASFTNCDSSV